MEASELMAKIRSHPAIVSAGMILCHNGIVRATSRDGKPVSAVDVRVDRDKLAGILEAIRRRPGIVEVLAEIREGRRSVGEDLMILVIAGDFRENVIAAMTEAIDLVKGCAVTKEELYTP